MEDTDVLVFFVNGIKIEERQPDPCLSLLDYLRRKLFLTGCKAACAEGGCGACTVMLSEYDNKTEKISHFAVLACILPVCCVHGLAVTTVEGIGSTKTRLHPVQVSLFSPWSGCHYSREYREHQDQATPSTGMIMSMYALLRSNPEPSEEQIRRFLDGNLCRCSGYRTIIDGFETFAKGNCGLGVDCCRSKGRLKDEPGVTSTKNHSSFDPSQEVIFPPELKNKWIFYQGKSLVFKSIHSTWYRPASLAELLDLKSRHPDAKIAVGNTEISVETHCKGLNYHVFIGVSNVSELRQISRSPSGMTFGSAVTISNVIEALKTAVIDMPEDKTRVFRGFLDVLKWFGNTQIRNVSSIGGNVITASPLSDLIPKLMAAGATVRVARKGAAVREIRIEPSFYVKYRTTCLGPDDVLLSVTIPSSDKNEFFHGYKQSSRKESCVATCNAGMRVLFEDNSDIIKDIYLAFGSMAPTTIMATHTMSRLIGSRWQNDLVSKATSLLAEELHLTPGAPGGMCEYRQSLTISFFYKFYLFVERARNQSGAASDIPRPLRSALLDIDYTLPSSSHVCDDISSCQPAKDVGKVYGVQHATGETMFLDDMAPSKGELFMSLVLSQRPHARLVSIDATEALTLPGVVDFITHKDIPGEKTWGQPESKEIFASDVVLCRGQTIGAIVAESSHAAEHAASRVNIVYEDLPHFLTIKEAIENEYFHGAPQTLTNGDPQSAFKTCDHVVEGEARTTPQEHFYLETMGTLAIPGNGDKKTEVYTNRHSSSSVQETICKVLGVASNKVEVKVTNPGGAFCGNQTLILLTSLPAAVAAQKLGRPVRCVLDRHVDTAASGTRYPTWANYKVGFDSDGNIVACTVNVYVNAGMSAGQSRAVVHQMMMNVDATYNIPNLAFSGHSCKTNLPCNTSLQGFGVPQVAMVTEQMIQQVADKLQKTPEQIRLINLHKTGGVAHCVELSPFNARRSWEECISDSQFESRRKDVDKFNSENRWRKRGLSMVPVRLAISSPAAENRNRVNVAPNNGVDLMATGVRGTSDRKYSVCGASCSEVEVDCLSGEHHVTRTDLVIDAGRNLSQAVDIGQIEGAFMLGYGLYVLEDYQVSPEGLLLTLGPGTYKIPSIGNIPSKMNVHLLNDINKEGSTNELEDVADLSVVLSLSVFFAIADAVKSARADAGSTDRFQLDCPATPDAVRMACEDQFTKQIQPSSEDSCTSWVIRLS